MTATTPERGRDAQRTRNDILDIARREFSDCGYDGARVDRIAARTRTTKRMIYYYFGSKEQLFEAVLAQAYAGELPAIELVSKILARGHADGAFRRHPDPVDVHMMISSFCVFRVAHQHTFRALFGRDLTDPALGDRYRAMIGDMAVDYLTAAEGR
jgi:AcrR family transcriptional regulator